MQSHLSNIKEEQHMLRMSNSFKLLKAPKPIRPQSTTTTRSMFSQNGYGGDCSSSCDFADAVEKNSKNL